jgi:uncharacterized membrane protein YphA (DoxX/SURF4 family)
MPTATNIWMAALLVVYFVAGIFIRRDELRAARGWERFILLGPVFMGASLAAFAPEHFKGPEFVQQMVPAYMPVRAFWPPFVGCCLLAAGASLVLRKFARWAAILLGAMFTLFVCMIWIPLTIANAGDRQAWLLLARDSSFAAGCWALAGVYNRDAWPRFSGWVILIARMVIAVAVMFFGWQHLLHPECVPGVPSEKLSPAWLVAPHFWAFLVGAILVVAAVGLAVDRYARLAAASVGTVMTFLTVFLYGPLLILALRGSAADVGEALNYVADTLLYAGIALALALAMPRDVLRQRN